MDLNWAIEYSNFSMDIFLKPGRGTKSGRCISSSRIDAHKNMPCRSLAHLSMAHSPLEWKRLKADVWRCDMFETWWWCLLHSKAYDFLSQHIFLCKFSIDMMGRYMWWIYENMVCLILITAIFLYRKQTLIIINRLGYRQSLCGGARDLCDQKIFLSS